MSEGLKKYQSFFGTSFEAKKRLTPEENLEEAIRMSHVSMDERYDNRWCLTGPGTNKLLASYKLDPELTIQKMSQAFPSKIETIVSQLKLWQERAMKHGMNYVSHNESISHYSKLLHSYTTGEAIDIAITPLMNPGYDHLEKDTVLTLQLPTERTK